MHITDGGELAGINPSIIERARVAAGDQGGYTLRLEQPVYVAVMSDAHSGTLRRTFYQAWTTRASDQAPQGAQWDNSSVMEEILRVRHELARLLEFANYADYALATRMAKSTGEVFAFLEQLRLASRAAAEQELCELEAVRGPGTGGLGHRLLVRAAATRTLFGLAGGAAAIFLPAARAR